jgi:hypothetical protein
VFIGSKLRHIAAFAVKLQPMLSSQIRDKFLVRIRLGPAQLVIEMNDRENDPECLTQFDQQTQERNRIDPARDRDANSVAGPQ